MKTQLLIHPEELSEHWIERAAGCGVDVLGIHPVTGNTGIPHASGQSGGKRTADRI